MMPHNKLFTTGLIVTNARSAKTPGRRLKRLKLYLHSLRAASPVVPQPQNTVLARNEESAGYISITLYGL